MPRNTSPRTRPCVVSTTALSLTGVLRGSWLFLLCSAQRNGIPLGETMSTEDAESDGSDAPEGTRASVEGAVPRALSVLEALARARAPMRLTALSQELGIQKSTMHRILSTLSALDYVSQDRATGCYRASLKMWEIGARIVAEHPVKRAAAGFLHALQ